MCGCRKCWLNNERQPESGHSPALLSGQLKRCLWGLWDFLFFFRLSLTFRGRDQTMVMCQSAEGSAPIPPETRFQQWSTSARDWIITSLALLKWYYDNLREVLEYRRIPRALKDAGTRAKSPGFSTTSYIVNVFGPSPACKQITFSEWMMGFGLEEMDITHCCSGGVTTIKMIKNQFHQSFDTLL